MNRNWSQIQARKVLMSIPGMLKAIHVAKFNPVPEPYKLQRNQKCESYRSIQHKLSSGSVDVNT